VNPREFVESYIIRSLVCCFSGGRDSLVATHYTLTQLEDLPIERWVVTVDTTVMIPTVLEYVERVAEECGWPLKILRPETTFWELAERWGFPTIKRRWCCYYLKLKPIIKFVRTLKRPRAEVLGLRREESPKRRKLPQIMFKTRSKSWGYCPIIDWTKSEVTSYIKKHNLPDPPHYRLGLSETCLCGVYTTKRELLTIKAQYPQLFNQFIELETRFRSGGSAFYLHGKPLHAKDLAKQKTLKEMI